MRAHNTILIKHKINTHKQRKSNKTNQNITQKESVVSLQETLNKIPDRLKLMNDFMLESCLEFCLISCDDTTFTDSVLPLFKDHLANLTQTSLNAVIIDSGNDISHIAKYESKLFLNYQTKHGYVYSADEFIHYLFEQCEFAENNSNSSNAIMCLPNFVMCFFCVCFCLFACFCFALFCCRACLFCMCGALCLALV